jgi:dihydrofolate reductase
VNVSIIVASSKNGVIGVNNQLPWRLSSDLKYFKRITLNKPILMGRKTYESIGKPLPQRQNIILTNQKNFLAPECIVTCSISDGLEQAAKFGDELMVIGGAQIYVAMLPLANKIYLTEVDCEIDGDAFFPKLNLYEWTQVSRETHNQDEKNQYKYSFIVLEKN